MLPCFTPRFSGKFLVSFSSRFSWYFLEITLRSHAHRWLEFFSLRVTKHDVNFPASELQFARQVRETPDRYESFARYRVITFYYDALRRNE